MIALGTLLASGDSRGSDGGVATAIDANDRASLLGPDGAGLRSARNADARNPDAPNQRLEHSEPKKGCHPDAQPQAGSIARPPAGSSSGRSSPSFPPDQAEGGVAG